VKSGAGGRSYIQPLRAVHAVSAGLQLGLSEIYRRDMRPLELLSAMQLLFSGSKSLSSDWVDGGMPFAEALATDLRNDPAMREISGLERSPKRDG
jgi:hypothetical protein